MRHELRGLQDPRVPGEAAERLDPQELLDLAKEAGCELSDEQLEAVSGGDSWACWDIKGCTDVCARY
ncbi:MAG: hypothetical protein J6D54_11300 [Olsenella sp.]|nr:hypothetical protein [Olsenella sp.]